jgi:hypothetical protein
MGGPAAGLSGVRAVGISSVMTWHPIAASTIAGMLAIPLCKVISTPSQKSPEPSIGK